ncbi:response regulator [Rhodococcus erythropolis]|uniref:response regulator n=1 Tax=Rhodococcus erythropolis TaxID=1833 RepID=UPI0037FC12FE
MDTPDEYVHCDRDVMPSIMVVDSDRRVRTALARLMKATRPQVAIVETADVSTALVQARSTLFDLVLVDMALPDLVASCALIRQLARNQHVVALSVSQDDARHAMAAGALDFVEKTASSESFLQAVRATLVAPLTFYEATKVVEPVSSPAQFHSRATGVRRR